MDQDFIQLSHDKPTKIKIVSDDEETGRRSVFSQCQNNDHYDYNDASDSKRHPEHDRSFQTQFYAFRTMSMPYFRSSSHGCRLFSLMILLVLCNSAIRVYFSYIARDFWNALSDKDADKFYRIMATFAIAMVVLCPISVAYRYVRQMLAIRWREWLTDRVLGLYFQNRVYYCLERRACYGDNADMEYNDSMPSVDNPDQRISEDIRSFTELSLSLFHTLITSIIDLICFSIILFIIMPQLFIAIFLFATLGTALTICIGRRLIGLNYDALQREADFRFSLVRVRENAESIAFYTGEAVEEREAEKRFGSVIENMDEINRATRNLDFLTTSYSYLTWILPIIVTAPQYFAGNVDLGMISQASAAFGHILEDLSIVITSFTDLSKFSAGIDRLYSFMSAIRELDPDRSMESLLMVHPGCVDSSSFKSEPRGTSSKEGFIRVTEYDPLMTTLMASESTPASQQPHLPVLLSIRSLKLVTPDNKRVLLQTLDLSVVEGKNLLITGASGSGKSSLLRAIAGLWSNGAGEIVRPKAEHVYFLPQRPYCPPGTLREQLLYPSTEDENNGSNPSNIEQPSKDQKRSGWRDWGDQDLLNVLEYVDLPDLASRSGDGNPFYGLNTVLDWSNTLSLGEQQRLAFGRLVINRPRLVVLDESTSALDVSAEKRMYTLLKEVSRTYISVGHRPTLLAHHDLKLSLSDGIGRLSEIPRMSGDKIDEGFILT